MAAAAQTPTHSLPALRKVAITKAELMRKQIATHARFGSVELLKADREQAVSSAIARLKKLKPTISSGEMSIREMIEEGRR